MKTNDLLLFGALGVGGWFLYKQMQTAAPAPASSGTSRYVAGLGRRPHDYNTSQGSGAGPIPWWMNNEQYGSPYGGGNWGPYGWQPYSPSAAFGPSPVEMETPNSLSYLTSQVDAGF